jgi:copper(I)-binding protein
MRFERWVRQRLIQTMNMRCADEFRRIAAVPGLIGLLAAALAPASGGVLPGPGALAREFKAGSITIEHPWSRATPGGAQVAVGYLTIKNNGATEDRLVSATAEIGGRTEIHQMSMADGVMKMRQMTDGLPVPAQGSVALEPNSYHLMVMELKRPLKEGEEFSGTLSFEKAGIVDVTFEVEGRGAAAPKPDEHHHH